MSRSRNLRAREYLRVSRDRHGKSRSVDQQHGDHQRDADAHSWTLGAPYVDNDRSASRYAKKARGSFPQLLADLRDGEFRAEVLMLWESSRGSRQVGEWVELVELCESRGVRIWVHTHGTLYDPANPRHRRTLLEDAVDSEYESAKTRQRILRDVQATAEAGKPAGLAAYGYVRRYDPATRELVAQEEHPEHAAVVREILARIVDGETLAAVTADLNARKVPPPSHDQRREDKRGKRWYPARVREICRNESYLGVRKHNGDRHKAVWPAIVDPEQFWAARRILDSRAGQGWRSARADWLLTSVVHCGVCGSGLAGQVTPHLSYEAVYRCRAHGCVRVPAAELEEYVLAYVLGRLARPDVHRKLRRAGEGADREEAAARAEAARLRAELEEWRDSAARGETTPATMAKVERGYAERIEAADKRAERAGMPPAVRALAGADDLPARWAAMPMAAQRDVVAALVAVTVHRTEKYARPPVAERVTVAWKGTA